MAGDRGSIRLNRRVLLRGAGAAGVSVAAGNWLGAPPIPRAVAQTAPRPAVVTSDGQRPHTGARGPHRHWDCR